MKAEPVGRTTTARLRPVFAERYLDIDPTWTGLGGLHGGVLLAAALEAAAGSRDRVPLSATAHFNTPVPAGNVRLASICPAGPGASSVTVKIGGHVSAMVRTAREVLGDVELPHAVAGPEIPDAVEDQTAKLAPPVASHMDIRAIGPTRPLGGGDAPKFEAWIRIIDGGPADWQFTSSQVSAILIDALPPGLWAMLREPVPFPTMEMTAQFSPASVGVGDWLLVRQRTVWTCATHCVDEAEVMTRDGRLAATGRQTRRIQGSLSTAGLVS